MCLKQSAKFTCRKAGVMMSTFCWTYVIIMSSMWIRVNIANHNAKYMAPGPLWPWSTVPPLVCDNYCSAFLTKAVSPSAHDHIRILSNHGWLLVSTTYISHAANFSIQVYTIVCREIVVYCDIGSQQTINFTLILPKKYREDSWTRLLTHMYTKQPNYTATKLVLSRK